MKIDLGKYGYIEIDTTNENSSFCHECWGTGLVEKYEQCVTCQQNTSFKEVKCTECKGGTLKSIWKASFMDYVELCSYIEDKTFKTKKEAEKYAKGVLEDVAKKLLKKLGWEIQE